MNGEPSFNSLRDIVPSFPLAANEVLVVRGRPEKDHVLIPAGITPSKSSRYKVNVMAVEIIESTDHGPVIHIDSLFKRTMPISSFIELINEETIIEKHEYTVDPNPEIQNDSSTQSLTTATLHFDGASRGNPGPAATGFVLTTDDDRSNRIIDGQSLGERTNNYAEYHALLDGVRRANQEGITDLTIKGDSKLIIKQTRGEWDCNADHLAACLTDVRKELKQFNSWSIEYVPRSTNTTADTVANKVLDFD